MHRLYYFDMRATEALFFQSLRIRPTDTTQPVAANRTMVKAANLLCIIHKGVNDKIRLKRVTIAVCGV